jgi:hypothetical protein
MLQSRIYRDFLITKDRRAGYTAIRRVNPGNDRTCFTSCSEQEIKSAIDGYWGEKSIQTPGPVDVVAGIHTDNGKEQAPSTVRRRPMIPKDIMDEWRKEMHEKGKMLPPDHPIYSEPPTIIFSKNRMRKPHERKE